MKKYDIVNGLAPSSGIGRYLEICTPTTGVRFGNVDPSRFAIRHRLMYRCPETYDDGLELTFRTTADGSQDLVRALYALQGPTERYDVIFVDPWHSYAASITDLHGALCLLAKGGVLVVHDCNPVDAITVMPEHQDGAWCGVTYQAFIDFVLQTSIKSYCVVDCDYGCGVVFGPDHVAPSTLAHQRPEQRLIFEWQLARLSDTSRYAFFNRNRHALLNLTAPLDFVEACDIPYPEPAPSTGVPDLSRPALEPDKQLSVTADGEELILQHYSKGWHAYTLPKMGCEVYIVSPTLVPSELDPNITDHRELGLAVAGIKLDHRSIDLADPTLAEGWYTEEAQAGYPWRWTNGRARLRLPKQITLIEVFTTGRGS